MTAPLITSRQNSRVKLAAGLRGGRERRKAGRFLIDGEREIRRAIECGVRPLEAFVEEGGGGKGEGGRSSKALAEPVAPGRQELVALVEKAGAEILHVTAEVFERLYFGEREGAGVVVVAETLVRRLEELENLPAEPLVAVIEGVEKPGNVGAILRTADAAGVDAVIVADGGTDLFNPNTIRASLGTVFNRNVVAATTGDAIAWLREKGLRAVAARVDAELDYAAADLRGGVAIVLGSEAAGLSDAWRGEDIMPIRLPMRGIADSLNVSTTAAVLFYEAARQRSAEGQAD